MAHVALGVIRSVSAVWPCVDRLGLPHKAVLSNAELATTETEETKGLPSGVLLAEVRLLEERRRLRLHGRLQHDVLLALRAAVRGLGRRRVLRHELPGHARVELLVQVNLACELLEQIRMHLI